MILSLAIVHNLLLFFCLVKYIYLIQYLMHQIYVFINYSIKNHEYLYNMLPYILCLCSLQKNRFIRTVLILRTLTQVTL